MLPFGTCLGSLLCIFQGRVACEISSADTLMLTEMIFGGVFTELDPPQMAALLSCFVFEEKATLNKLPDDLSGCLRSMQVREN